MSNVTPETPEEIAEAREWLNLGPESVALIQPDCRQCGGKGYQGTAAARKYLQMCECIIRNDPDYPFKGEPAPTRTTPMQAGEAELRAQMERELFGDNPCI